MSEVFGVIMAIACFGISLAVPIAVVVLFNRVRALENKMQAQSASVSSAGVETKASSVPTQPSPLAEAAVVPPPLPVIKSPPVVRRTPEGPSPLGERLRELGLLPPNELKGEYAMGAWWAVRVGGALAVAAVVFFGIWLNLRSQLSPLVRLMEVVLIGLGLFAGGLRLSNSRPDLGRVVTAVGLAVLQFAAWATHGLDRMRVVESPSQAAGWQFAVALVIAFVALWLKDKLFAQMAVVFSALAVFFSIKAGADPVATSAGAASVALIGALLLVRGGWASSGILGLLGSQACLILLYNSLPAGQSHALALQLGALASFGMLYLGERLLPEGKAFADKHLRLAYALSAFLAPALVALLVAGGGEDARATTAFVIAALALVLGTMERFRSPMGAEILYLSGFVFAAAGAAWLIDAHLVWLVWILAAALGQLVVARFGSQLMRWAAEGFALTAALAFLQHSPAQPWFKLLAVAVLGLLLAYREDWARLHLWHQCRRFVGVVALVFVALEVQKELPKADTAWPWLVLFAVAAFRYRPGVVWAAIPAYLCSHAVLIFWTVLGTDSMGWAALWSLVLAVINAYGVYRLNGRKEAWIPWAQASLAFLSAVAVVATVRHTGDFFWAPAAGEMGQPRAQWLRTLTWTGGALLVTALTYFLRRAQVASATLIFFSGGFLLSFGLQLFFSIPFLTINSLAAAPLWLLGLGAALTTTALDSRLGSSVGTPLRVIFALAFMTLTFGALEGLPGAGVSLCWALAAILCFALGHVLQTRSFRMVGLVGLAIVTIRVVEHDITDILGRVAACGAIAVAFFLIAWLYGRSQKADGPQA